MPGREERIIDVMLLLEEALDDEEKVTTCQLARTIVDVCEVRRDELSDSEAPLSDVRSLASVVEVVRANRAPYE